MADPRETRPAYSTSKRALWLSSALAWLVIIALVWGALNGEREAVAMASIVVPSMVLLIAAMLGIHRAFGSMDMRTMRSAPPRGSPRRHRPPDVEEAG
jgi:hypothetical protein